MTVKGNAFLRWQTTVARAVVWSLPTILALQLIRTTRTGEPLRLAWWFFAAMSAFALLELRRESPRVVVLLAPAGIGAAVFSMMRSLDLDVGGPDSVTATAILVGIGILSVSIARCPKLWCVLVYGGFSLVWTAAMIIVEGVALRDGVLRFLAIGAVLVGAPLMTLAVRRQLGDAQRSQTIRLSLQQAVAEAIQVVVVGGTKELTAAVAHVARGIGADAVTVERYTPSGGRLLVTDLWASGSCPLVEMEPGWLVPPDEERALADGRVVRIDNEIHGAVLPIVDDDGLVGGVRLACQDHHHVEPEDLGMIGSFAKIIGVLWTREAAVLEAEESKAALQAQLESKDQFVASVSHELRTPLAAVLGFSSELADEHSSMPETERCELAAVVASQAAEVSHIVEDLLVAARAESDMLTIVPESIDLRAEIDDLLAHLDCPTEVPVTGAVSHVVADRVRARQIVRNLVTNAFRHGGSKVWVELSTADGMALVSVHDDGPGVPEDHIDSIFDPYERAHQTAGLPQSVGLGLAVARQLSRLMGGDVRYSYVECTTFTLTLPVAGTHEVATESLLAGHPL